MPPAQCQIRRATAADAPTIAEFNYRLAHETEDKQLDRDLLLNGVTRGLQQEGDVQYFVAESGGEIIGQLMLTREWSDWRNGWAMWLQSVYVHADHRSCGIFRQLLEHAKQQMQADPDVVMLRLYVEKDNTPALATYHKLGFEDPGYRVLEMPM